MSLALTTRLDAVNIILESLGVTPRCPIDDQGVLVAKARVLLEQVSRQVQAEGWEFNTECDYTLLHSVGPVFKFSSGVRHGTDRTAQPRGSELPVWHSVAAGVAAGVAVSFLYALERLLESL